MKHQPKAVTETEKNKQKETAALLKYSSVCVAWMDTHWKNSVPRNHICAEGALKANVILTILTVFHGKNCALKPGRHSTGSNGVFVSRYLLLHRAPLLDLEPSCQALSGFPQRLQEQGLLIVTDNSEPLRPPLMLTDGADGVTENIGLCFLLAQGVPEYSEVRWNLLNGLKCIKFI